MALLGDEDRGFLENHLAQALVDPVRLVFFTQQMACQFCRETEQVLSEVASLSEKIGLEVLDFVDDADEAARLSVDKIPATAVLAHSTDGDGDYGVRFYGLPSGYEFSSLIEAIVDVSRGDADVSGASRRALSELDRHVHVQVFVTPTCPYCPPAVRAAHSLALVSPLVRADMVESIEFPQLAIKYGVQGVPRTVINEGTRLEGAMPEPLLVAHVMYAAGQLDEQALQAIRAQYRSNDDDEGGDA